MNNQFNTNLQKQRKLYNLFADPSDNPSSSNTNRPYNRNRHNEYKPNNNNNNSRPTKYYTRNRNKNQHKSYPKYNNNNNMHYPYPPYNNNNHRNMNQPYAPHYNNNNNIVNGPYPNYYSYNNKHNYHQQQNLNFIHRHKNNYQIQRNQNAVNLIDISDDEERFFKKSNSTRNQNKIIKLGRRDKYEDIDEKKILDIINSLEAITRNGQKEFADICVRNLYFYNFFFCFCENIQNYIFLNFYLYFINRIKLKYINKQDINTIYLMKMALLILQLLIDILLSIYYKKYICSNFFYVIYIFQKLLYY